jgi:membrane protein
VVTPRARTRVQAAQSRLPGRPSHRFSGKLQLWSIGKQAVRAWLADYAPSMGAAIAYYTIFSIAPLLLIVIAVAGLAFGQAVVRDQLVRQLGDLLGD